MTVTATLPRTARRRPTSAALRQGALVAATSGLALSMAVPVATANPAGPAPAAPTAVEAAAAATVSPTVVVPEDAQWTIEATAVEAERPAPVQDAVADRSAAVGSRSAARTALDGTAVAPAPVSASAAAVLEIARRYVGVPYVYGGTTPAGFDCSGYTQYVFAQVGVSLPRTSSDQRYAGTVVSAADARPGDLVWWPGHVGIYTGGGNHIAARQPGTALYEGPIYNSSAVFIRVL